MPSWTTRPWRSGGGGAGGPVARVGEEAWPDAGTPDEMHDALLLAGFLTDEEGGRADGRAGGHPARPWGELLAVLEGERRAGRARAGGRTFLVTAERLSELRAVHSRG